MKAEQDELYFYTKEHFKEELSKVSHTCISPQIAVRQIVKEAIYKYVGEYCHKKINPEDIFSNEDFVTVSQRIYDEIVE